MNAHDAWTLAISVLCSALFVILLVEVFRGIWSLSKTTPLDRSWNRDDLMRLEPADVVIRA